MRVCSKCRTENADTNDLCERCGATMISAAQVDSEAYMQRVIHRAERRDRRLKLGGLALGAAVVVLFVLALRTRRLEGEMGILGIVCSIMGLLMLLIPDELFKFQHMFDIANVDEIETTDFYKASSAIGGVVLLLVPVVMFAAVVFGV